MRLTIVHRLAIAILSLTLLVLIATLGLARWSFDRGFLDYVTALEQSKLELVPDAIAQEYIEAGRNWTFLSKQRLTTIIRNSRPADTSRDLKEERKPGISLEPETPSRTLLVTGQELSVDGEFRGRPDSATAVYDANGEFIVGDDLALFDGEILSLPIVADGSKVGDLRSVVLRILNSPQDTAFSAQQLNASWIIGAISLFIAGSLSFLLAGAAVAPLRRMIENVNQLSQGDYSVRMRESRTDELGQLMEDFDQLALTLEEARSSRRRWFADISHELRTPVTILCGEFEALKHGLRNLDENYIDVLTQEVNRLRHLIDDLYDVSISGVGGLKYDFSSIDLASTIDDNVNSLRSRFAEKGYEITLNSQQVFVKADRNRIDQLCQNLLNNSLAYTDAPGRIDINLSKDGGNAVLTIQDTAPGATNFECERLLDPLYRMDSSRSRRTGGAGLGLAICHNIVEAHGGKISATPSELGGLCIRIEIPMLNKM